MQLQKLKKNDYQVSDPYGVFQLNPDDDNAKYTISERELTDDCELISKGIDAIEKHYTKKSPVSKLGSLSKDISEFKDINDYYVDLKTNKEDMKNF